MYRQFPLVIAAAAALAVTGCASTAGSSAPYSALPSWSAPSSAASSAPSAAASSCMTKKCIAEIVQQSLAGMQARDGSVLVKATCRASTVRHNPDGSWTVACDATYSDQTVWSGLGTYLPDSDQVTWQPQEQVR